MNAVDNTYALSNVAEQIYQVGEEFENIAAVFLFGSYARGEQRADSDIDIGVVTGGPLGTENVFLKYLRFLCLGSVTY